jgi:hypothetical protein
MSLCPIMSIENSSHRSVVFSPKHAERDALEFDEMINGKRIRTLIVRTNFERATDVAATVGNNF